MTAPPPQFRFIGRAARQDGPGNFGALWAIAENISVLARSKKEAEQKASQFFENETPAGEYLVFKWDRIDEQPLKK